MFMLQIIEQIHILNGNNIFFRNETDLVRNFSRKRLRDQHCVTLRSCNIMTLGSSIENISRIKQCDNLGIVCILNPVCSLHFAPNLHFKPNLQSAICSLHFIQTVCGITFVFQFWVIYQETERLSFVNPTYCRTVD